MERQIFRKPVHWKASFSLFYSSPQAIYLEWFPSAAWLGGITAPSWCNAGDKLQRKLCTLWSWFLQIAQYNEKGVLSSQLSIWRIAWATIMRSQEVTVRFKSLKRSHCFCELFSQKFFESMCSSKFPLVSFFVRKWKCWYDIQGTHLSEAKALRP